MPHVLYILPVLQPAGAERVVAELARRIPKHGFTASVLCLEDERASIGVELVAAGVEVKGLRISRRRTLACAAGIARELPADRPLILHSHLFHANLAARMAVAKLPSKREGVTAISTIHVAERRFRPWQFILDALTARHAAVEVCVSRAVETFQRAKTGLPAAFFRVIENGIDLSRFTPGDSGRAAGRHVVSVGRLDPQKDVGTLLRAWRIVADAMPDARLSIAGAGPSREELERLRRELGITDSVSFLGFVTDIPALLHTADLYVQASAWEGFGLTVAEAMACRLPVVVTDADSLPEVVDDRRSGRVVPKRDPERLAAVMLELLNDRGMADRLASAAREEATKRFDVERMVGDYAKLYREILERKAAQA